MDHLLDFHSYLGMDGLVRGRVCRNGIEDL